MRFQIHWLKKNEIKDVIEKVDGNNQKFNKDNKDNEIQQLVQIHKVWEAKDERDQIIANLKHDYLEIQLNYILD